MVAFERYLQSELSRIEAGELRRRLTVHERLGGTRVVLNGEELVEFASNDYLGLARDARVREASARAAMEFGAGSGSARLVCGSTKRHEELERGLAAFKGTEGALTFSSGFATALGVLPALAGPGDTVVVDRLAHACLVDAARLSRARLRVFRHNDLEDLDRILTWTRQSRSSSGESSKPGTQSDEFEHGVSGRVLIVTESVFSMDGDRAPLAEIVALKERHEAWLMVDEAHATGIAGPGGRGVVAELGLGDRVEVPMGTLGKALGSAGGFVAGSTLFVDYLVQKARSFVFTTAPPPAVAAAALAALAIVASEEGEVLRGRLRANIALLHGGLQAAGWRLPAPVAPILPVQVGPEAEALRLSAALREAGYWVPAIRYPTVARGRARLRITVSAAHTGEQLAGLLKALECATAKLGIGPR